MKNIIIWLIGVCLIILLCVLAADWFSELRLLLLDGGVLICVYSLFVYVYGGMFYNKGEFARDIPAAGVRMYAFWLFSTLSVIGIIAGYALSVPFKWQTFYQLCFLFLMIVGLLAGKASTERLQTVADNSMQLQQSKEQLVYAAQQLRVTVSVNQSIDGDLKTDINKLVERIGYISPSSSPMAKSLEASLGASINQLHNMLNNNVDIEDISKELVKANALLSQRLKTY